MSLPLNYLSFANDERLLGAILMRGTDLVEMVKRAHRLGVNPGGQVLAVVVPDELAVKIGPESLDRLLSIDEIETILGPIETLGEAEARGLEPDPQFIAGQVEQDEGAES